MFVVSHKKTGLIGETLGLRNPGITDLEIFEFKSASHLGEGDVVRVEDQDDRYGAGAQ
ncbi:hypothetical protein DT070_07730 [Polaromonas sp. SP1]|nr:hypothetical protein DT070_07730 [Polaromonas sp. SP1]QGJ17221.1 hypothetical protein F7R28_01690 [Polaromonas sp. Pch-P]